MAEKLWQLERRLWSGGPEIYRQNLHAHCLMTYASGEIAVREAAISAVAAAPRWKDIAITSENVAMPREDVAVLAYHAWARREDGTSSATICSSTWIEEGGLWRLVQHQQSSGRA